MPSGSMTELYERLGGGEAVTRIVAHFYRGVAEDPILRPLYPADLVGAEHRLALFLAQWTGGPHAYEAERGHPRLRMRHFSFEIGAAERDAWMEQMTAAVTAEVASPDAASELLDALARTADFLINAGGLSLRGGTAPEGD